MMRYLELEFFVDKLISQCSLENLVAKIRKVSSFHRDLHLNDPCAESL
jgi:hypothetical protein